MPQSAWFIHAVGILYRHSEEETWGPAEVPAEVLHLPPHPRSHHHRCARSGHHVAVLPEIQTRTGNY